MNDDDLLAIAPDNRWRFSFLFRALLAMIDLSGIARQLHLSVDQIRIAADLLEQGYAPTYIRRYRADETGSLPKSVLWRLKLYIERQKRLQAARERVVKQVPKEVVLDAEAQRVLESSRTVVAMESALRSFRARRSLEQSQEKDSATGQLLEKMLTYSGPAIDDLASWAGSQIGGDSAAGQQALVQVSRLLGALIQCDTGLISKLRHAIQRKATIRVEDPPAAPVAQPQAAAATATSEAKLEVKSDVAAVAPSDVAESNAAVDSSATTINESIEANLDSSAALPTDVPSEAVEHVEAALDAETSEHETHDDFHDGDHADSGDDAHEGDDSDDAPAANEGKSTSSKKSNSKMTPRQRRRRWLVSMLAPLRSIKKPVNKLTAFQHLMLGRGVRSQLISTPLDYDRNHLIEIARDSFTDSKHPLASWFNESAGKALDGGFRHKLEAEALAELEEEASEHLLEHATDELRLQLMRRPVRGHTICLVDTVGPKSVSVVVVDPSGNILASDELPCSVQPEVVNQNVVVLGQLIHKHRVTLVALTNGPVRRFMVATLRELMIQSKDSGLRWTMADRSGAEAYAGGRVGLRELATYNRRERAAVWAARCLQNPLVELLKIDISRMRLGSYQRELPQETLKRLVIDTIVDCVCSRGIDTHHASEAELQYVPGVAIEQAKQIVQLAASGNLTSRAQLKEAITGWPEAGLRQAIGWLRVFDSSATSLDATLIHPDDYRLAERLVENTELPAPPAAPPSWTKKVAATKPVVAAPSESETASTDSTSSEAEVASGESTEAVVSQESAESVATDTSAEVAEAPVSEETSADASSEALDPIVGFDSPSKATEAAAPATPAIAPEYPEDIVASAPPATTVDAEKLANQWQVGRAKLKSIASALQDPFADPRLNGPAVPLRTDLPTLEDLQPDTCVWAIVVGVADFGAFVELAPNCSGLIHISRLSMNFIEDPHQCVQVGDLLMTWVVNVDTKKNRVALTALSPAQRADAAAANEERRAQVEQERSAQRGGPRGGDRGGDRGPRRDGPPGRPGQARRTDSAPQRTGGSAGGRTGQPAGASHGGGGHGGGGHGSGGHGGGQGGRSGRPERGGGGGRDRDGSRGRGGRRGGDEGGRPAKSVVVTSKKPVAPISQAMKQGEEPLRSFSDLMQYYESNRSPKSPEPVVEAQTQQFESNDHVQNAPVVADTNSDSNDNTNG